MSRIFEVVQAMSGQKNCIVIPGPYLDYFAGDQQSFALAAVLNQLVFWTGKSSQDDGWFYKTHEELAGELRGVSEDQVQRVVNKLRTKYLPGVIEVSLRKVNGTPKNHYRIDGDKLIGMIFPPLVDSAESRNGKRETTESTPQNRVMDSADSREQCREAAESYLYTDQYTDHHKQIQNPCQSDEPTDEIVSPDELVLTHFNSTTNSDYKAGKTTMGYIRGRLAEDYTAADLILIVDYLTAKWLNDPKMSDYLRPKTLFGPENCAEYFEKAKKWRESGRPACVDGKWLKPGQSADAGDHSERDAAYLRFLGRKLQKKNPSALEEMVRGEASKAGVRSSRNADYAVSTWNRIWADCAQRLNGGKAA
ncbi:TPA: conserved phage C-terminal domain-containing protein [Serratia marcescens]|nr:conserved phage C-terminal domain-containing protein [Serratia marcescens]HEN7411114.1 conserved phage C-terminal domain-containing protein [Serratia marcescens]